jgi:hypothetical protein
MKKPRQSPPPVWSVLPRQKVGARTEEELYFAVGFALSAWELVEEGLAELFALFIAASEAGPASSGHEPAIRAYASVISFKSRQGMVGAAADAYFHKAGKDEPLKSQIGSLIDEIGGHAERRNDIAHGRVQLSPGEGFYLFPGLYNIRRRPIGQPLAYAYDASQVHFYGEGFRLLSQKLADHAIFAAVRTPPKPSQ